MVTVAINCCRGLTHRGAKSGDGLVTLFGDRWLLLLSLRKFLKSLKYLLGDRDNFGINLRNGSFLPTVIIVKHYGVF